MEQAVSMTVTHLVGTFRHALLAVIPSAEAVAIGWKGDDRYDDWDRIEEVLFHVLVVDSVRGDLTRFGSSRPFRRYGFDVPNYRDCSWFEVAVPEHEGQFALVQLLSGAAAIDEVQVARVEPGGTAGSRLVVPWSPNRKFVAQLRSPAGALIATDSVTPTESVV
jgi:hypothetical protein